MNDDLMSTLFRDYVREHRDITFREGSRTLDVFNNWRLSPTTFTFADQGTCKVEGRATVEVNALDGNGRVSRGEQGFSATVKYHGTSTTSADSSDVHEYVIDAIVDNTIILHR